MTTVPAPGSAPLQRRCPFDPPAAYQELREHAEIGTIRFPDGQDGRLLTSHHDVAAFLSDPRASSRINSAPSMPDGTPMPAWFFGMDPPEHTDVRRLLVGSFTLRAARRRLPMIQRIVDRHIAAMRRAGPPVDLFTAFAWPVPGLIVCELLGLDEPDTEKVEHAVSIVDSDDASQPARRAAWDDLRDTLLSATRGRHLHPGGLLHELSEPAADRPAFTAEERASIGMALRLAGQAPVAHVVSLGLFALLQAPDQLAALRRDPARIAAAVDELLRYLPTNNLGVFRLTTADVPLNDQVIPGGELVFVSLPTANRDPAKFTEPDRLNLLRDESGHLAFGHGAHKCLGQNLAKLQIEVMVRTLLTQFPALRLTVDADRIAMYESETSYGVASLPIAW